MAEYPAGTRFRIQAGESRELPKLEDGLFWKQVPDDGNYYGARYYEVAQGPKAPNLREENDKLLLVIEEKDLRIAGLNRTVGEQAERISLGLEQNRKLQDSADEWREKYHLAKPFERVAKDRHEEYVKEVKLNERLQQHIAELQKVNETDKDCAVPEQSPAAKAYEDIHTKRMAAEVESIELDNLRKKNELKFGEDYPHSIWHNLSTRVKEARDQTKTVALVGSFTGTAILINEVAQWVNL